MTDYQPFLKRLDAVIAELGRDYDYEDAEIEGEEIGLDANECLVMGLENRVELGRANLRLARDVIFKLTTVQPEHSQSGNPDISTPTNQEKNSDRS